MNVLAIGAHPDDLEFMCAGTLLKCRDRGDKLFVALTTSGNTGSNTIPTKEENAAIRESEQLECCKIYGAETMFMRFEDEGLLDTPETRRAVLNAIRWANPDLILCNPPWDASPDHGMTGRLVTEVLECIADEGYPAEYPPISKNPSVFFYNADAAQDAEPDIFVDISQHIEEKKKLCLTHRSQFAWIADVRAEDRGDKAGEYFAQLCEIRSRYYGLQAACKYAEGFVAHIRMGHAPNYKLMP